MTDTSDPIRVLVVDDDRMASTGISAVLATAKDITVVGNCTDGDQVVDAIARTNPDVVLCDMKMPRMDGFAVTTALAGRPRGPKVLMMTAFDEDGRVLEAVSAGAAGFLMKDDDPARIVSSVRDVFAGEAAFSPRAASQLTEWVRQTRTNETRQDARNKLAVLTARERDFALALVTGASDAELAAQFFLSPTTVKSALTSIKSKWGVANRTQIAVIVARSGLA